MFCDPGPARTSSKEDGVHCHPAQLVSLSRANIDRLKSIHSDNAESSPPGWRDVVDNIMTDPLLGREVYSGVASDGKEDLV